MKAELNSKVVALCVGALVLVIGVIGFLQFGPSVSSGPEIEAPIPEGWVKDPKTGNIMPPYGGQPTPTQGANTATNPK